MKTDGYSGAEIVAICQEAALLAMDEDLEAEEVSSFMNTFIPFFLSDISGNFLIGI